jgi:N6-adenosine-specific RNA methylase IME4
MLYRTIYADPPWYEQGGGKIKRGANRHYPLMKTPVIAALPIAEIADENCHLYLWATNNHLHDAMHVASGWGFRYVTLITWAKDRKGLGQYFRGQTEHCIFAVKGRLPYRFRPDGKRAQGSTLITAPRTRHSEKPSLMRSLVELVSHPPRVELFAREHHEGWDVFGNEVQQSIHIERPQLFATAAAD